MLLILFIVFTHFQSKRKFERECKEAEKSQLSYEKLDNDINATKSEVEKVWTSTCCKMHVYPEACDNSFITSCLFDFFKNYFK